MQSAKPRPNATRAARQLNSSGSDLESVSSSPSNATRKPKGKAPKAVDRSSRRNSAPELVQLQEELRNVKNQLNHSDSEKTRAQAEAADARKQLEETQRKLLDLSDSDDARFQELRKISLERDKAWKSELEAVHKQKSLDSAALSSAMNEIKKLKLQLEWVVESEASKSKHAETAYHELRNIREELSETLVLVENLRNELCECRDSEARALEMVGNTQMMLDIANATAETLHSETMKAKEALDMMSYELEKSRAREVELEATMRDLQGELNRCQSDGQLKFALETSGIEYCERHLPNEVEVRKHSRSTLPNGNDPVPHTDMEEFRSVSTDDSEEVRKLTEENELLKENFAKAGEDAAALLNAARLAEKEALTKLGHATEEADKNSKRAARQLEEARVANSETETELRRLKVQMEQWRKAAELAAAMLSGANEGKVAEIRGSVEYSRFSLDEDDDDDGGDGSPKKWNGNMLKKIGVLWKKGHK